MARQYLLDTGFLLALLSRDDPHHQACLEAWKVLRGELFTVEGVLVELAHLLRRCPGAFARAVELVEATGCSLVPLELPRLVRATRLMERYREVPMDLVDALLVAFAEESGIRDVLTVDRRGFRSYRALGRGAFVLHPA